MSRTTSEKGSDTIVIFMVGNLLEAFMLLGVGSYLLGFGLSCDQKAPMVLGTCTRNV